MRCAILAVALGGVLLTGAACHSDAQTTKPAAAPATPSAEPTSPAPDYSANTKLVCGNIKTIFNNDLQGFSTQIGKMIADKEAKQAPAAAKAQKAAAEELKKVGAKVKAQADAAQDPQLRLAGATSAAKFVESAGDTKFFDRIKTAADLNRTIEPQMAEWLNPVTGYCG